MHDVQHKYLTVSSLKDLFESADKQNSIDIINLEFIITILL